MTNISHEFDQNYELRQETFNVTKNIKQSVDQIKPWRRGTAWWVLLVEGIVAASLGFMIIFWPAEAGGWVLLILAGLLTLHGLLTLFDFLRGRRQGRLPVIRGAIGLIIGMTVLLMALFNLGDRQIAAWLLATGLLVNGVLALLSPFIETSEGGQRGGLLMGILLLVLGGLLLYNLLTAVQVLMATAWTLLLLGAVLIVYSLIMRRNSSSA
jgi:uncharacterized membrane protein HdeD (DUF308 family)